MPPFWSNVLYINFPFKCIHIRARALFLWMADDCSGSSGAKVAKDYCTEFRACWFYSHTFWKRAREEGLSFWLHKYIYLAICLMLAGQSIICHNVLLTLIEVDDFFYMRTQKTSKSLPNFNSVCMLYWCICNPFHMFKSLVCCACTKIKTVLVHCFACHHAIMSKKWVMCWCWFSLRFSNPYM